MIIDKLINWISSKSGNKAEDVFFGLVAGLVAGLDAGLATGLATGLVAGLGFGLAFGLVAGIVTGLGFGLAYGLATGLAFGLAFGLAAGLATGLAAGLVNLLATTPIISNEWILLVVLILGITEALSWLMDKSRPTKGTSVIAFTLKRKGIAFLEATYLVGNALGAMDIISKAPEIYPPLSAFLATYGFTILGAIGIIALAVIGIAAYIWLNSLKYKRGR